MNLQQQQQRRSAGYASGSMSGRSMSGSGNSSFSGSGYDRWTYEQSTPGQNDTTLNKIQHKFWVTKQAVVRKLGKDEDQHIVASDAELDAKLELFRSINETTSGLQRMIEYYQDRLCSLSYEENAMGRFLKEYGKADKTKAGKMMVAVGKTMSYSGQQRLSIRVPLVRLYQEVETFRQRAIEDTHLTLKNMEKMRTEYRGALMWMQNVSKELDPDTYKQLEKFRKVQGHVKQSKAKFDKLKLDCLQKVDLLAASRCNMFSHALIMYQNALITFWEKTAKTMTHVNNSFQGYQHYEFSYIKDLAEPNRMLTNEKEEGEGQEKRDKKGSKEKPGDKDDRFFFQSEYKDDVGEGASSGPEGGAVLGDTNRQAAAAAAASSSQPTAFPNLLDISDTTSPAKDGQEVLNDEDDDPLLNFGESEDVLCDKDYEQMPMLTPACPLPQPTDKDDALLLQELMNGPSDDPEQMSEFSAQWSQMSASALPSVPESAGGGANDSSDLVGEDEFSQFMSCQPSDPRANDGTLLAPSAANTAAAANVDTSRNFLPSHLFDLDQSLYSSKRTDEDMLRDFPMPSPARPAAVQKQLEAAEAAEAAADGTLAGGVGPGGDKKHKKKSDMSQWFNLFADLDPLANPDAIGKTTKQEDKNCYS